MASKIRGAAKHSDDGGAVPCAVDDPLRDVQRRALRIKLASYMATYGWGNPQKAKGLLLDCPAVRASAENLLHSMCDVLFPLKNGSWRDRGGYRREGLVRYIIDASFQAVFTPKSLDHRAPDNKEARAIKDILAAGVMVLASREVPTRRAAKDIARLAARRNLRRSDGKSIDETTVYEWWKERRKKHEGGGRGIRTTKDCIYWCGMIAKVETGALPSQTTAIAAVQRVLDAFLEVPSFVGMKAPHS